MHIIKRSRPFLLYYVVIKIFLSYLYILSMNFKKYYLDLKNEYVETKSYPNEDFLEWLIQRKMTWGMRWTLVIILMFVIQPLTYHPMLLLWCFYIGLVLFVIYILGQILFLVRDVYKKYH